MDRRDEGLVDPLHHHQDLGPFFDQALDGLSVERAVLVNCMHDLPSQEEERRSGAQHRQLIEPAQRSTFPRGDIVIMVTVTSASITKLRR